MRVKSMFGALLIAAMSIACGKDGGTTTPKDEGNDTLLYVKNINAYDGIPTNGDINSQVIFGIDSQKRINSMRSVAGNETIFDVDIEYSGSTATVTFALDGESGTVNCELNDKGAITSATYDVDEMAGFVESFTYNDANEMQSYKATYMGMELMSLEYEWRDGNIYKVTYCQDDYTEVVTHTYTADVNIYNIDPFHGFTWNAPYISELLAVNDGLFGKRNRNFVKSVTMNGESMYEIGYSFKTNGELEYANIDGDGYMTFDCF